MPAPDATDRDPLPPMRRGARTLEQGVTANGRLTGLTGVALLVLLAVEGYTVLDVGALITLHIALGLTLIGPVLWKCLTTGWRFAQYYRGRPAYVAKGAPPIILRVLGPVVILTSLAVLGTGVGLIADPGRGLLLTAHQASFVVWFGAMAIHVLGHVVGAMRSVAAEFRRPVLPGRAGRFLALGTALLIGGVVAVTVYPAASAWTDHRVGHRAGFSRSR